MDDAPNKARLRHAFRYDSFSLFPGLPFISSNRNQVLPDFVNLFSRFWPAKMWPTFKRIIELTRQRMIELALYKKEPEAIERKRSPRKPEKRRQSGMIWIWMVLFELLYFTFR